MKYRWHDALTIEKKRRTVFQKLYRKPKVFQYTIKNLTWTSRLYVIRLHWTGMNYQSYLCRFSTGIFSLLQYYAWFDGTSTKFKGLDGIYQQDTAFWMKLIKYLLFFQGCIWHLSYSQDILIAWLDSPATLKYWAVQAVLTLTQKYMTDYINCSSCWIFFLMVQVKNYIFFCLHCFRVFCCPINRERTSQENSPAKTKIFVV